VKNQPVKHASPSDAPPGTRVHEAAKRAPIKPPVQIDKSFVSDPRGGPYLAAPHGIEVKDNRTKSTR
jgi:hypothetical protein